MIFDHIVKINGKYYEAGEEVNVEPETEAPEEPAADEYNEYEMNSEMSMESEMVEMPGTQAKRGRPKKAE